MNPAFCHVSLYQQCALNHVSNKDSGSESVHFANSCNRCNVKYIHVHTHRMSKVPDFQMKLFFLSTQVTRPKTVWAQVSFTRTLTSLLLKYKA